MTSPSYGELLRWTLPELALVLGALAVLAADFLGLRDGPVRNRWRGAAAVSILSAGFALALLLVQSGSISWMRGIFVSDPLIRMVQAGLLIMGLLTFLVSSGATFTRHPPEYFALLLLGLAGMLFMVGSENLLVIFTSLELASICLYTLVAFAKADPRATEAGLQYFFFGSMSAAFTLFGISLLYGITGNLDLRSIATALQTAPASPLLIPALVMLLTGFGSKVAFVPFHLWVPETYRSAPVPSAALIASASKLASFFLLAKVLLVGLSERVVTVSGAHPTWVALIALVAALSMVIGNLAALAQRSVKRLLAFSAIAHAGYVLLGILAQNGPGLGALVYYLLVYGLTIIGAFAIVGYVERITGTDHLEAFAGLRERSPTLAFCLAVFLLSLAGIPPLAGFFGKFYLFAAALNLGGGRLDWLWLVVLALLTSAVSLYYYLLVLKQAYVRPLPGEKPGDRPFAVEYFVVIVLALAVILLGCAPEWLIHKLLAAAPFITL